MEYLNAKVVITINGPNLNEKNSAKKSLNSKVFYEYNTVLKNTGIHDIKITIESQIGKTEILEKIDVKKSTNILNTFMLQKILKKRSQFPNMDLSTRDYASHHQRKILTAYRPTGYFHISEP